jgi:hypothetical protein
MDETILVPNVESGPDTRNVYSVCLFNSSLVSIAVDLDRIEDAITVVKEVHAVARHSSLNREAPEPSPAI